MINERMYALGTKPSCIRELFEYGLKQAAIVGKENVFDYSLGNPSVPSPEAVIDAFRTLTQNPDTVSVHSYTPARGEPNARAAVAADLTARSGMTIRPDNIFFTCGAAPALVSVLRALSVENSEVAVIAPFFPEYRPFVEFNGSKFVIIPADQDKFQIDFSAMENGLTANTQAIIVNSPNNPSGAIYTRQTLTKLAALLTRKSKEYGHPIYIIADEPYRELVYDGAEVPFIPTIYPNTIVCYSYSKSFSLPGERIGYFCVPDCVEDGNRILLAAAGAARVMGHVCAPSLQQKVVGMCATVKPDLSAYDLNRKTLYNALTAYGYQCVFPDGAFYLFVKAPFGTSKEFSDLAKQKNLLIVPGDDFGCPEYFRLSTCVSYEMICKSLPLFEELIKQK